MRTAVMGSAACGSVFIRGGFWVRVRVRVRVRARARARVRVRVRVKLKRGGLFHPNIIRINNIRIIIILGLYLHHPFGDESTPPKPYRLKYGPGVA
jgi:hypothetical protein